MSDPIARMYREAFEPKQGEHARGTQGGPAYLCEPGQDDPSAYAADFEPVDWAGSESLTVASVEGTFDTGHAFGVEFGPEDLIALVTVAMEARAKFTDDQLDTLGGLVGAEAIWTREGVCPAGHPCYVFTDTERRCIRGEYTGWRIGHGPFTDDEATA